SPPAALSTMRTALAFMAATARPTPRVKSEAEPEADVGRADDVQVEGAEARDLGVVAEQADPQATLESDDQADRSAHLCLPKIISGRNGGAAQTRSGWQQ